MMTVRQVLDTVAKEMGLKALDNQSAPADYVFSQLKVNEEDIEGKSIGFLSGLVHLHPFYWWHQSQRDSNFNH